MVYLHSQLYLKIWYIKLRDEEKKKNLILLWMEEKAKPYQRVILTFGCGGVWSYRCVCVWLCVCVGGCRRRDRWFQWNWARCRAAGWCLWLHSVHCIRCLSETKWISIQISCPFAQTSFVYTAEHVKNECTTFLKKYFSKTTFLK